MMISLRICQTGFLGRIDSASSNDSIAYLSIGMGKIKLQYLLARMLSWGVDLSERGRLW
jgi:hypothetical protein